MDFGEVLGRAWRIIWKHKILWVFGLFAGCSQGGGGGGGGGGNSGFTTPGSGPSGTNPFPQFPQLEQQLTQFGNWIEGHLWVIALVVLVFLGLIALSIWLGIMGRIGLIKGTALADAGAERLGFGEVWGESTPYFWRVFLLGLLVFAVVLVAIVPFVILAVVLSSATRGLAVLCLIPMFCVLLPLLIAIGLVIQVAEPAIVLEDLGVMAGLARGWDVLKRNIGPVLVIWLILLVIGLAAGLVISLPVLVVLAPALIAFVAGTAQGGSPSWTPLIIGGLCFVAYLPVLYVLRAILTAYVQSTWALTYMRLTRPKEPREAPITPIPAPNA